MPLISLGSKLIKILTSRLNFMFNNMQQQNSSSTYATVISYTYPLLLVLSNYSKIIKDLNIDIKKPRYKNGYDIVQNINKENNYTNFNIFDIHVKN